MRRQHTGPLSFVPGLVALALAAWPAAAHATGRGSAVPHLDLGWEYDLSGAHEEFLLPDPLPDASVTTEHPFYVRLRVPWSVVEPEAGRYVWYEVDRVVDAYRAANHVVLLCLYGGNRAVDGVGDLPTSNRPAVIKSWLEMLRAAASHFKGRVLSFEIGRAPNLDAEWAGAGVTEYAYLLKHSSVTVRSADPTALVVQGMLAVSEADPDAALGWQAALYRQDIATYVDALPVRLAPELPRRAIVGRIYDLLLEHDPSAQIWTVEEASEAGSGRERAADLMRRFVIGQGERATLASFELEADVEGRPDFPGMLLDLHRLFLGGYAPRPGGASVTLDGATPGESAAKGISAYHFFDARTYRGLVAFFAPASLDGQHATLILDTAAVRGAMLYDIIGGTAGTPAGAESEFKSNTTRVPVILRSRPLVLLYERVPVQGFEAGKEQVAVSDTGLITVEEIIASHQRFMADQDFRLRNYRAAGRVTYHYKIGGSNTIDVGYDNNFFWDEAQGAEWQQTALYINGVRWKGTKFPNIPFIQPEKVVSLPLDINLDADYDYEYVDRERVDGYDCYVVAFRPREAGRSLYEGKVWIETRTFARVRASVVQTGLEPPVTSNDERDHYSPIAGPDGTTYWLLTRVEGQQIFTTAGRNLVVLREIDLHDFMINDPGFEEARRSAHASTAPILRDTDQGMRYLERGPDGERTVEAEPTRKTLFAIGGIYAQPGLDYPVPLLGVNYFNYNVGGRNAQLNAFIAGAVNIVTFTDPKLFGRVDASIEALLLAFTPTDTAYIRGKKRTESNVDVGYQTVSGWLGVPIGNFFRLRGEYGLEYSSYNRDQETDTFVVPTDTPRQFAALHGEFNRAGWSLTASAAQTWRREWEAWGDESPPSAETAAEVPGSPCDTPGSCLVEFDPTQDTYETYHYTLTKQFFLPAFQKIRLEGTWGSGSNLDRFSEFSFDFYGDRVRGFSGSGVRFNRGGIARLQYAFNIQDLVRFEASLDHAYVRDSLTSEDFARFTGFGISGNVLGPWQTILTFDVGVAVASDYEDLRGNTELQVVLFKFF